MAGIEKVDELTGEYEGWTMYSEKRNSIQVLNKNKRKFRGAKATLIFYKTKSVIFGHRREGYSPFNKELDMDPFALEEFKPFEYINGKLHAWRRHKKFSDKERAYPVKLSPEYYYCLFVTDPELQGRVKGKYVNWSFSKQTVIRKLKRLVGSKNLTIINTKENY